MFTEIMIICLPFHTNNEIGTNHEHFRISAFIIFSSFFLFYWRWVEGGGLIGWVFFSPFTRFVFAGGGQRGW